MSFPSNFGLQGSIVAVRLTGGRYEANFEAGVHGRVSRTGSSDGEQRAIGARSCTRVGIDRTDVAQLGEGSRARAVERESQEGQRGANGAFATACRERAA